MTNPPRPSPQSHDHDTGEWLDDLFDQYVQSLKPFKDNSPTAYGMVKTAIQQRHEAEVRAAKTGELGVFMSGVNQAAAIRTPLSGARHLNMDDVQYYLHNRRRVLEGKKAHTPEQWFEDVR